MTRCSIVRLLRVPGFSFPPPRRLLRAQAAEKVRSDGVASALVESTSRAILVTSGLGDNCDFQNAFHSSRGSCKSKLKSIGQRRCWWKGQTRRRWPTAGTERVAPLFPNSLYGIISSAAPSRQCLLVRMYVPSATAAAVDGSSTRYVPGSSRS